MDTNIATLHDVARLAGVSVSTASRILKAKDGDPIPFAEQTQSRVRKAATQLGYRPSKLARSLVGSRTGIVGLIVPSLQDGFFPSITSALQSRLNSSGYNVLLVNTEQDFEIERAAIDDFLAWRADGLIVAPTQNTFDARLFWELWRINVPFVLLDRYFEDTPFCSVTTDDRAGAVMAVEHLLNLGRTRIARACTTRPISTGKLRRHGYDEALLRHGFTPNPAYVLHAETNVRAGWGVVDQLMALNPRPDALFCFSDVVAVGVIEACLERGLRVPDDLAVVGYADLDMSRFVKTRLTTIRQPQEEIGRMAGQMLLDRLAGRTIDNPQAVLPVELVVRESTVGDGVRAENPSHTL